MRRRNAWVVLPALVLVFCVAAASPVGAQEADESQAEAKQKFGLVEGEQAEAQADASVEITVSPPSVGSCCEPVVCCVPVRCCRPVRYCRPRCRPRCGVWRYVRISSCCCW